MQPRDAATPVFTLSSPCYVSGLLPRTVECYAGIPNTPHFPQCVTALNGIRWYTPVDHTAPPSRSSHYARRSDCTNTVLVPVRAARLLLLERAVAPRALRGEVMTDFLMLFGRVGSEVHLH